MGYPMTYMRVVARNGLTGNYEKTGWNNCPTCKLIAGDMRRLEADQRDERHLVKYADYAGITADQASKVLEAFFTDFMMMKRPPEWLAQPCWPEKRAEGL